METTRTTTYRFREHFPDVRLVNLYGPTECSIGCIAYEVTGREAGRVRYRVDGTVEFLGRKDRQIKLREYRIELRATEVVLEERSGVLDAAAIVREKQPGQCRLVAYVVARVCAAAEALARLVTEIEALTVTEAGGQP